jgi:hypothetical protein
VVPRPYSSRSPLNSITSLIGAPYAPGLPLKPRWIADLLERKQLVVLERFQIKIGGLEIQIIPGSS